MFGKKKGQITLFIILGIIVLLIVGIAIFLIGQKKSELPDDVYNTDYDSRLAPVYNDVVFCMNKLGKEAVTKIGSNGGFVEVNPDLYSYNLPIEHSNNALELFPDSKIVIPYWSYITSDPNCKECQYKQSFPPLTGPGNSIQNQIKSYIDNNMITCLDNLSMYKADLEISYDALPSSYVELRDENVFIGLDWKLKVKFSDGTVSDSLNKYSTTLDVRLKKIYEYAVAILFQTEMMSESRAFEDFTRDILSFYSFGGENAEIPPVAGPTIFEFSAPKMWLLDNVKSVLKHAISETIPYMQVYGTKDSFVLFTNNTVENNFYSNFQNIVYYDDEFSAGMKVRFNYYEMWPLYAAVGPSNGPVIMPESSATDLWLFKIATTKYKFYYDITYPVLVTLEDDSAFGGEGFTFMYPFEVNIKNNNPYSNDTIDVKSLYSGEQESQVMGYEQRTVPIKLNVINGYTNTPLSGVTVMYNCIDKEHIVGTSEIKDGNTIINSYLAPCLAGAFNVKQMGYSESVVNTDVEVDNPIVLDYFVYPARNVTLEVRKRMFVPTVNDVPTEDDPTVDRQWALTSGEGYISTLEMDEKYILMISEIRRDGNIGNTELVKSGETDNILSLVPGKYTIQLISTITMGENYSRKNLTIPGREMEIEGETMIINDTVIKDAMYIGGLTIDDSTVGGLIIKPSDLMKESMVIYYPSFNPDNLTYVEDLNVLAKIQEAPSTNPALFTPKFE